MAASTKIVMDAEDQKKGMSIEELLEFAHQVEGAVKRGSLSRNDLLLGSIGFSAQIKRLTVEAKRNDRGVWNTP